MTPESLARLVVGATAELSLTVTDAAVLSYAMATGDYNPIHFDEEAGRRSVFGSRVAHGMLSAGLISAIIGTELPGPGSIYRSQTLQFYRPVRIGDVITARVEVLEVMAGVRHRVRLRTSCCNQDGEVVIDGEALVQLPVSPA